jgi:hypothetical protein
MVMLGLNFSNLILIAMSLLIFSDVLEKSERGIRLFDAVVATKRIFPHLMAQTSSKPVFSVAITLKAVAVTLTWIFLMTGILAKMISMAIFLSQYD